MTRPRRLFRIFLKALVVLLLSTPLMVILLALETQPSVPVTTHQLDSSELSRVERLLVESAPGNIDSPTRQLINLTLEELNLLLRYGIELLQLDSPLGAIISLPDNQRLVLQGSAPLLGKGLPVWLNMSAVLSSQDSRMKLDSLQVGQLAIPGAMVSRLVDRLQRYYLADTHAYRDITALLENIQVVSLDPERLQLALQWDPALLVRIRDQARLLLVSATDQQRIINHYRLLTAIVDAIPATTRAISLNALLVPMFAAAQQVTLNGGDPVAENRTLLMTLAMYVNGADMSPLLGPALATSLPEARQIEVRVQRRQDLAQHIVSSAAITASAGAGIAAAVSNSKEVYDARYRSGFSFSDLTANYVGVALGRLATESENSARVMQSRLLLLSDEAEYLPAVSNNQDGLSESDFNNLYRENPDEYQRRIAAIEARVNELPLFKGL
ncbi:MAG: hypothetical protein RLZZ385_458 [Pseudomonadota bacterium]